MPKATSQTFTHPQVASGRKKSGLFKNGESSASATRNHLFDTARFGQHILTNPLVAQGYAITPHCFHTADRFQHRRQGQSPSSRSSGQADTSQANLKSSDIVLEVGPGTGNLTIRILAHCRRVVAVEADPRMAAEVQKRVLGK